MKFDFTFYIGVDRPLSVKFRRNINLMNKLDKALFLKMFGNIAHENLQQLTRIQHDP